jgi:hypothetical protein
MNLWHVDFSELYQRHLCRHGQYGINVEHLATVVGTYLALFGILYWISAATWWAPLVLAIPYLALLVPNLPLRLTAGLCTFLGLLFTLYYFALLVSPLPIWLNGLNIPVIWFLYKLQALSHKFYTLERDMTTFNQRYPKGPRLFVLLSLYELPLLLNYLVFDRQSWSIGSSSSEISGAAEIRCEAIPTSVVPAGGVDCEQ